MATYHVIVCLTVLFESCLAQPPVTVPELNLTQYLGQWYQPYASQIVLNTFELNGNCQTATYGPNNATSVTVLNQERLGSPTGPLDAIRGYALTTADPGKLEVYFDTVSDPDPGEYWVLKLGPTDGPLGPYEYAIVSDSARLFLFILARNVDQFYALYRESVLLFLADEGFTGPLNSPVECYQGPDCIYFEEVLK